MLFLALTFAYSIFRLIFFRSIDVEGLARRIYDYLDFQLRVGYFYQALV